LHKKKNDTLKIDDSGLITTTEINKSMETNTTLAQMTNNKFIIE